MSRVIELTALNSEGIPIGKVDVDLDRVLWMSPEAIGTHLLKCDVTQSGAGRYLANAHLRVAESPQEKLWALEDERDWERLVGVHRST